MTAQLFLFEARHTVAPEHVDEFDQFWRLYPHRVCKGQARRAWAGAVAKVPVHELLDGVRRYIAEKPHDIPWCNPATFLNGERWLDEPATNRRTGSEGQDHRLRNLADMLKRGRNVGSVTPAMVREMVDRKFLTAEEARRAGF